jgi:hypothetical protein
MKRIFYLFAVISLLNLPIQTKAAEANYIVISEFKTSGGTGKSTDEFIELYNPTNADVNLNCWQLVKKTTSGSSYVLVDNFGDKTIQAHSFFLIAHPTGYLGTVTPDIYYTTTNSISDNNTIILSDSTLAVIDEVGYGTATVFETEAAANPVAGKSLERKARADSTAEMMVEGGVHYYLGNSEDSDNNNNDFIPRDTSEPQNSLSEPEYAVLVPPPPPPDSPPPPQPAPSYSSHIVINELFPNPKGTDDGEFIELYNTGDTPVNLNNWKLGDLSTRLFAISNEDFQSTVVAPHGYFVVDKKASGISLNNTSDAAKLYHPNDTLVNSVEYSSCLEAKSYGLVKGKWVWTDEVTPGKANKLVIKNDLPIASFEIESDILKVGAELSFDASDSSDANDDTLAYSWNFGDGAKASGVKTEHAFSKGGKFVVRLMVNDSRGGEDETEQVVNITDYDYSNQLVINELLPACQGPDADCEYVELYNPENRAVRLDGWRLVIKNAKYVFSEEATIKAQGYLVIKRPDSRLSLNNSGTAVNLVDPRGKIVSGVEYSKAKEEVSFSRVDGREWQWTTTPTPGKPNIFSLTEDDDSLVTAEAGDNMPVDLSSVITPLSEITEDKLGSVLKVSASVESVSGSNVYLVDEEGNTLRVYIQKATGIKKPELKSGDRIEVVGVLDKTDAGLRLLPRKQEDIVVLSPQDGQVLGAATEKETINIPIKDRSKEVRLYLIIGVSVLVVALVIVVARKRSNSLKIKNQISK